MIITKIFRQGLPQYRITACLFFLHLSRTIRSCYTRLAVLQLRIDTPPGAAAALRNTLQFDLFSGFIVGRVARLTVFNPEA